MQKSFRSMEDGGRVLTGTALLSEVNAQGLDETE